MTSVAVHIVPPHSSTNVVNTNNTSNINNAHTNLHKAENDEKAAAASSLKSAEDNLQSLCATHAATFVAVEHRGAELSKSLTTLIDTLKKALPHVETSKCSLEMDESTTSSQDNPQQSSSSVSLASLAEKHRVRRRTLLQHSSLLELLELPSLMDACVRGHLYEEALSIASFANTLERRHLLVGSSSTSSSQQQQESSDGGSALTQGNPVVANVVEEVRKRESDLRRHLLHRLRSNVTMPQCLEVVTALRRLNSVDLDRASQSTDSVAGCGGMMKLDLEKVYEAMERRLQVDFLEARDVWLEGSTNGSATSGSASGLASVQNMGKGYRNIVSTGKSEQLLDSIDVYRTRCFEITTQFIAIFRATSSSTTSTAQNHASQLLSIWTTRRIHYFLNKYLSSPNTTASSDNTNNNNLLTIVKDTATLRDILDSTTFFATSMGRIGADFSPLLSNIFEPCLLSIVTSHWMDGVHGLRETLKVCRDAGIASPLTSTTGTTLDGGSNAADSEEVDPTTTTSSKKEKTPSAPRQLLSLPPLARLVNSFLNGLNELRRCLLPNTFPRFRRVFEDEFVKIVREVLVMNERAVLTPGFLKKSSGDGNEEAVLLRSLAAEMKEEFESCVMPYLASALEVAFGVFEREVPAMEEGKDNDDAEDDEGGELEALEEEGMVDVKSIDQEKEELEINTATDNIKDDAENPSSSSVGALSNGDDNENHDNANL